MEQKLRRDRNLGDNLRRLRNARVSVLLALKKLYGCPYDAFFTGLDTADDAEA